MVADGRLAEAERLGQLADAGLVAGLRSRSRVGDHLQRRSERW